MKLTRKIFLAVCILLFANVSRALENNIINLVVPFASGSAQDLFARLLSEPLSQELNARVVVLNKPGAGGTVGATYVAQAKPDGQTYLFAASGHHLAGALHSSLPYHPLKSFSGVAFTGYSDFVLITSSKSLSGNLNSFVNLVAMQPKLFNYASSGNGSFSHVGMADFLQLTGLQMTHIPLKGTGEIINEILAGRVQAAMVSTLSIQPYKADPRINLVATTGVQRSQFHPELPTISESGYRNFKWVTWAGFLSRENSPKERAHEINVAVAKIINDPKMKIRFQQMGVSPKSITVPQFNQLLQDDWIYASNLINQLKLSSE
jgi:tripartite-type tricarboxylate transporter receptor subunit TctC